MTIASKRKNMLARDESLLVEKLILQILCVALKVLLAQLFGSV